MRLRFWKRSPLAFHLGQPLRRVDPRLVGKFGRTSDERSTGGIHFMDVLLTYRNKVHFEDG